MTRRERQQLRKAISLIAGDDGSNGGWDDGMKMLMVLAGYDTSHLEPLMDLPRIDAFELYALLMLPNGEK